MEASQRSTFTVFELGELGSLDKYSFDHPALQSPIEGKKFLKDDLGLTGMEVSFHKLPPRTEIPFHHKHRQNEELYVFLDGQGQFQVDGEIFEVGKGTMIRVAPEGIRTWRNNSDDYLYYIVIQSKAGTMAAGTTTDGFGIDKKISWPN